MVLNHGHQMLLYSGKNKNNDILLVIYIWAASFRRDLSAKRIFFLAEQGNKETIHKYKN